MNQNSPPNVYVQTMAGKTQPCGACGKTIKRFARCYRNPDNARVTCAACAFVDPDAKLIKHGHLVSLR